MWHLKIETMIDKKQFVEWVLKYFDFLIREYNFNYNGFKETGRDDILIFTKANLLMEIKYNYPNEYFDVTLFCDKEKKYSDYHYWEKIDVDWIVTKYEISKSADIYNKKQSTIQETIKFKSKLLKHYGESLLSGKEWFSWKDVSGWGK